MTKISGIVIVILGQQLGHLAHVILVVLHRVPICWIVAIPWREVDTHSNPKLSGGGSQFSHEVTGASAPGAGADGVVGIRGRPKAEAVVVLGCEDHAGEASGSCGAGPLAGVEGVGTEDGGRDAAGAPFGIGEGVGAEVEEEGHLAELPSELGSGGEGRKRERRRGGMGNHEKPARMMEQEEREDDIFEGGDRLPHALRNS